MCIYLYLDSYWPILSNSHTMEDILSSQITAHTQILVKPGHSHLYEHRVSSQRLPKCNDCRIQLPAVRQDTWAECGTALLVRHMQHVSNKGRVNRLQSKCQRGSMEA